MFEAVGIYPLEDLLKPQKPVSINHILNGFMKMDDKLVLLVRHLERV